MCCRTKQAFVNVCRINANCHLPYILLLALVMKVKTSMLISANALCSSSSLTYIQRFFVVFVLWFCYGFFSIYVHIYIYIWNLFCFFSYFSYFFEPCTWISLFLYRFCCLTTKHKPLFLSQKSCIGVVARHLEFPLSKIRSRHEVEN